MRVAVVHDWVTVPGGSEEVLREVFHLYPGVLFTSQFDRPKYPWLHDAEVRTSFIQRLPMSLTKHQLYAPVLSWIYPRFDFSEFDLVLSDSHSFAHGIIKRPDALHVNYYHAPARALWLPEIDDRARGVLRQMIARKLRNRDLVFSKRPDVLFANSQTTADRIERFYGRKVDRVIYPPVHTGRFLKIPRRSDDEGFLMWGRHITYKRFDLAVGAAKKHGFKLNLVGSGPLTEKLKALAAGHPNIVFHGRLPDADLDDLISRSRAVLFPCYEDFGIVPVEAMAAGVPVIAYGEGGAGETVRGDFGVIMRELSVDELVRCVSELETRHFDPDQLRDHARTFDVEVFRKTYREEVERALAGHAKATRR